MGEELFSGWTSWLEEAYLVCTPEDPECLKFHYMTRSKEDKPEYSLEEEIAMINEQIEESEGFDIDFSLFRCVFNYHLVDPDDHDFVDNLRNEDLMKKLSQESLKRYNDEWTTKLEFLRVVKANFHFCNGYMFLITFEALDDQEKTLQARVFYSSHYPADYVFCRLKPHPNDETDNENTSSYETYKEDTSSDETSKEDGL